ncbi:MAG: S41 family peptidase [Planctomycetota bacterium]|nr:S41 family peptidase [Planctomycetota bacterium]
MTPLIPFVLCLLGTPSTAEGHSRNEGWMTQPTLHRGTLVFVSEGDLFTTSLADLGNDRPLPAHRLTSHVGRESHPRFSPDGRWLAFTAEYGGNPDVFVMPAGGGVPTQLTYHPDADEVVGWSTDGAQVLFRSGRAHPHGRPELWRVDRSGGMPAPFRFGDCSMAAPSSGDGRMAFCRWTNEDWNWKNYRGGTAPEIWVGDPANRTFSNLTRHESNDLFPVWSDSPSGARIQFLSDRTGTPNIWSMRPDGSDLVARTDLDGTAPGAAGFDIRFLAGDTDPDSDRLVFEQGGSIGILDPQTGAISRPRIHLSSDRPQRRARLVPAVEHLEALALSPLGDRLAFIARGEVFSLDLEEGLVRRVTSESGIRHRGLAFLGEAGLVLITDAAGEEQLVVAPVDGPLDAEAITAPSGAWYFPPVTSPDERWVVAGNARGILTAIDLESGDARAIARSPHGEITDYRISPDSRWVAWSMSDANQLSGIHIAPLDASNGEPLMISEGMHHDFMPRWDPAGAYLWFVGDRSLDPHLSSMEFRHAYGDTARIYAVCLDPLMPPPDPMKMRSVGIDAEDWSLPYSTDDLMEEAISDLLEHEDASDEASDPTSAAESGEASLDPFDEVDVVDEEDELDGMILDPEGISQRVHVVEGIPAATWTGLEATWGGFYLLQGARTGLLGDDDPEASLSELLHYDIATGATPIASGVSDFAVSADGGVLFATTDEGDWLTFDPMMGEPMPQAPPELLIPVDTTAEWAQILDESWRLQRDFFWNPELNGVDWDAMRTRYHGLLERIGTRDELDELIGRMLSELQCSHAYIWQEGPPVQGVEHVPFAMLGADLAPHEQGFRIERILPGRAWDPATSSPLAQPWLGVAEGDVIVEIDGREVVPGANPWSMLAGITGPTVELAILDPATGEVYDFTVPLVFEERNLRYQGWVDANRAAVDAASGGRFGYLHLSDMDGPGLSQFAHQYYGQVDRDGLVIDVRNNGGGFVSQLILDQLAQEVTGYDVPRHGAISTYPQHAFPGHLVVVIDQHAGSDGDIFPYMFREMGLGPLIGMRTWGGVVGIRSDKGAVDGGMTTQPEYATLAIRDGWGIENYGVDPDIEIDWTPADHLAGRDPQLERAIEELRRLNAAAPVRPPELPAYPRSSRSPLQDRGNGD